MYDLNLSAREMELVQGALALMQDVDDQNGYSETAAETRNLIERLQRQGRLMVDASHLG